MGYLKYNLELKTVSWLIVIVYLVILGIIFLRRMSQADKELKSVRILYRSIAMIFYFYILNRVFFMLSDFERDLYNTTPFHYQLVNIGYIFTELAFLNMLYYGEKFVIKKTRFLLTYITIFTISIQTILVFNPELFGIVRTLSYTLSYALLGLVGILFIRLTAQSTGTLRRNFLLTLLGLAVIAASGILESDAILSTGNIPPWLTPLLFAIGATIITLGMRYV
jgi:hypothetical protein